MNCSFDNLTEIEKMIVENAVTVRKMAYCPYSNFSVGAALLDENNCVHTGCNVESCDYTLTTHAEMLAIDSMVKSGGRNIKKIAIAMATNTYSVPCGLCRQKMVEFSGGNDVEIFCVNLNEKNEISEIFTSLLSELLPYSFSKTNII